MLEHCTSVYRTSLSHALHVATLIVVDMILKVIRTLPPSEILPSNFISYLHCILDLLCRPNLSAKTSSQFWAKRILTLPNFHRDSVLSLKIIFLWQFLFSHSFHIPTINIYICQEKQNIYILYVAVMPNSWSSIRKIRRKKILLKKSKFNSLYIHRNWQGRLTKYIE